MKSSANILVVQNRICSDNAEDNINHVTSLLESFIRQNGVHPDFILLPEFFTGPPWYFPGKELSMGKIDETIPGRTTHHFSKLAQKYNTYIICGTIVEYLNGKYYNTSALISPSGEIMGKTRKVHRFASEINHIESGTEFPVYDTEFGKIAIVICSDFWIMEVSRILALKGVDILFVPAASLVQNLEMTIPAVKGISVLNGVSLVYSSVIGKTTGIRNNREITIEFKGNSCVVTPKGSVAEASEEECILYASLDLEYLRSLRVPIDMSKDTVWWGLWGRQPALYGDLREKYVNQTYSLAEWFEKTTK
ncbi:MAG: carbon-nitrogen hydrolase family protein [Ferruginibacter sp.]